MAIDYKKEWRTLKQTYGRYLIPGADRPHHATTLDEVMNFQIQHTIMARERLMEEFIKENLTTEIDGGNKNSHNVNIIFRGGKMYGKISVSKKDFDVWCKKKGGK